MSDHTKAEACRAAAVVLHQRVHDLAHWRRTAGTALPCVHEAVLREIARLRSVATALAGVGYIVEVDDLPEFRPADVQPRPCVYCLDDQPAFCTCGNSSARSHA